MDLNTWCNLFLPNRYNPRAQEYYDITLLNLIDGLQPRYRTVVRNLYNSTRSDALMGYNLDSQLLIDAYEQLYGRLCGTQVEEIADVCDTISRTLETSVQDCLDLQYAATAYLLIMSLDIPFNARYILANNACNYVLWRYKYAVCIPYLDYKRVSECCRLVSGADTDRQMIVVSNQVGYALDEANNIILAKYGI